MEKLKPIKLSDLNSKLGDGFDLFICSSSYEDRCLSVIENIDLEKISKTLVIGNKNLSSLIERNGIIIRNKLKNKYSEVDTDTTNPLLTADNIKSSLEEALSEKPQRLLIDITTLTREALLILLKLIRYFQKNWESVYFVYTSASNYSINEPDPKDKWLSKGIGEIRSVLGYPGEILPSKPVHLIVLVGFEPDRAASLIDKYEPTIASLGYGEKESVTDKKHFPINRRFYDQIRQIYSGTENFVFHCDDPYKTKIVIDEQIAKFPGYNVVIAPMNTKISTLGVALAAFDNEDIQVCYAQPNLYNYDGYSIPGDNCYLFELEGLIRN